MQLLYRPRIARTLTIIASVYLLSYLWWRASSTLNGDAFAFSIVLLSAELLGAVSFFLFAFTAWDIKRQAAPQPKPGLRVDVYVLSRGVDRDLLEATLLGCSEMTYPHKTYVLDETRRPSVEELATGFGCAYLSPEAGQGATTSSLSAALPHTDGDYVAILTGDTVPQPDFLEKTLGYFVDERLALVQLPQEFYNLDSMQHAGSNSGPERWHDEALFHQVVQPGKNRLNAAAWCGSPSIVRRAALESIADVVAGDSTEEAQASIRLHARGWKTVHHDQALAFGTASSSFQAYVLKRWRWAQATVRLICSKDNPLLIPGLTWPQRLSHLASTLAYFEAYQMLIYVLTPPLIILTGVLPLRVAAWDLLAHWSPYFLLGNLAIAALGRGHFNYTRGAQYKLLRMFPLIFAGAALVWPRRPRASWRQTDSRATDRKRSQLIALAGKILLAVASMTFGFIAVYWSFFVVASMMLSLSVVFFWGLMVTFGSQDINTIVLYWAWSTLVLLAVGVCAILRRRVHQRRQSYRFATQVTAVLEGAEGSKIVGTAQDLSRHGAGVVSPSNLQPGCRVSAQLHLPNGLVAALGEVVHSQALRSGGWRLGVRFHMLSRADLLRLISYLYVALPRHPSEGTNLPAGRPAPAEAGLPMRPTVAT